MITLISFLENKLLRPKQTNKQHTHIYEMIFTQSDNYDKAITVTVIQVKCRWL